jgi:hypothetical protein
MRERMEPGCWHAKAYMGSAVPTKKRHSTPLIVTPDLIRCPATWPIQEEPGPRLKTGVTRDGGYRPTSRRLRLSVASPIADILACRLDGRLKCGATMSNAGAAFGFFLTAASLATVAISLATGRTYWRPRFVDRHAAPGEFRLALLCYSAFAVVAGFIAFINLSSNGR